MLFQSVNQYTFVEAFERMGRGDQFSRRALVELFHHLDDLSDESPIELDVIALCCEWSEYTSTEFEGEHGMSIIDAYNKTTVLEVEHLDGNVTYLVQEF
jgi:hypothetical protein